MKTWYLKFLFLTFLLACGLPLAANENVVYMLRLDDEIGAKTWRHASRAMEQAKKMDAKLFLVHLNTYGGQVDYADSIRTLLLNSTIPTVGFVDNNAASAGALIALACDSVYMRPGSTMGAATVVNGTDGQAMPDKYQSYMRGMMRSTAEHHGRKPDGQWRRNPTIAEAMVDSRVQVAGLIDSTKVLTFTPEEAIKWGYADGKAQNIQEVLEALKATPYQLEEFHPTYEDNLIGFLSSPGVQAVLIMIIIGGIYFELQSPGMGFPSLAALVAAIFYFLPGFLTGIASGWVVLLFVAGLILLLVEIFIIPGFGITGFAGLGCIAAALIIAMVENLTFTFGYTDMTAFKQSLIVFCSGAIMAGGLIIWLSSSHGPKWAQKRAQLSATQQVGDGFIGVDMKPAEYVGQQGIAQTPLRPSGKVEINGQLIDAVSTRGFIAAGTQVTVIRYENAQIYVK